MSSPSVAAHDVLDRTTGVQWVTVATAGVTVEAAALATADTAAKKVTATAMRAATTSMVEGPVATAPKTCAEPPKDRKSRRRSRGGRTAAWSGGGGVGAHAGTKQAPHAGSGCAVVGAPPAGARLGGRGLIVVQ